MDITFDQYLKDKKIDPSKFQKGNQKQFEELKYIFDQVHPNSFTAQKLFLINDIRRSYPIQEEKVETEPKKKAIKPKIKIQPRK